MSITSDSTPQSLQIDAMYAGGRSGNAGDDPLPLLVGVSNQGGFRYRGSLRDIRMLVLTTNTTDTSWPDGLNRETGVLTYFGDNKKPGRQLHATPRHGNEILRDLFERDLSTPESRANLPPILVFSSAGLWRDVIFLGLAVPGSPDGLGNDDLVAVWRTINDQRFQNYRARFSVLDIDTVDRAWLEARAAGHRRQGPPAWENWVRTGKPKVLVSPRPVTYRTVSEQQPANAIERALLDTVLEFFEDKPILFEYFAAEITRLLIPGISSLDVTRPSRDGGRDAVGQMLIGVQPSAIEIDFAVEAKFFSPSLGVGVKAVSRLISRLRHRQFGVLVTTSHLGTQAYKEIVDDGHPIVVIAGGDIARILRNNHLGEAATLTNWLSATFHQQAPIENV